MNNEFESLLRECQRAIERFVFFRLPCYQDAEDILQEVYMTAFQKFHFLKDRSCFKAWMLRIASNKCNDYFRRKMKTMEIPLDSISENELIMGRCGTTIVQDTMERLKKRNRQILWDYYFCEKSQAEIAKSLGIPVGTVKSRLYYAKSEFREKYPRQNVKGEVRMLRLPKCLPDYKIERVNKDVFTAKWEEMMGWFIVPRIGEKITWGMWDFASKVLTEYVDIEVVGKAEIHGIEGVEIVAVEYELTGCGNEEDTNQVEHRFVAQLTDTHCRFLAESHMYDGVRKCFTFLDGDEFLNNWGFGENNCGNEIYIRAKGDITRNGSEIRCSDKKYLLDVVGRYKVTIGEREFDTICIVDVDTYNPGVMSEQYLDQNGRTILWRRFNHDDWAFERYGQKWSEKLPDNERLTVNGELYVHWYDCVTNVVL